MNRILVTGSNGQLGSEIRDLSDSYPSFVFYFTDSKQLDISRQDQVENFIISNKIDVIINCAAYTAVDLAEEDSIMCDRINNLAVRQIGELAKKHKCKLIHISTDYVFDGMSHQPYVEGDITNPISVYGQTKLNGELALKSLTIPNSVILRTSWVYSAYGKNFVKTMMRLSGRGELNVIFDQIGTPTYANDLAEVILDIIPKIVNESTEVYHYSNEGVCSWYDFAKAIFELCGIHVDVTPIEGRLYVTKASRPFYSVMNKSKIKNELEVSIPFWRDSLKKCIDKLQ